MFSQNSQPPEDDHNKTSQINPRARRKKSMKNKKKRKGNKKKAIEKKQAARSSTSSFATITMSSWAESFTHAATWQLKQQVAYWKSKATALDYENQLLHDIIRENYLGGAQRSESIQNLSDNEDIAEDTEETASSEEEDEGNDQFEVSEEYIQFLMQNAKYKEDAKRERELLKAKHNTEQNLIEQMETMPTTSTENKEEQLKKLYGEKWQRIAALETSVRAQFLSNCDRDKPEYWPNIPLNFNFK